MKALSLILLVIFSSIAFSQESTVLESQSFNSKILGHEAKYSIYLPAGYKSSARSYPVLYLLHGFTDNEIAWVQFGEVQKAADAAIASGEAAPMIIVMPDAGVSWYVNSFDGKINYEDFFIKEFIPYIESAYHIRSSKEFRAIAGLSMGGFGTLLMAVKHPDLFSSAAPLSAGIHTEKEFNEMTMEKWNQTFSAAFGKDLVPEKRFTDQFRANYVPYIIKDKSPEELKKVRYYIDCGDKDFLIKGNMDLHALLIDKGVPHEFRVRSGVHNWTYWREALPEVLQFISEGFHR